MYIPVEAVAVVVNDIGDAAWPPAGGVTVCGRLIAMPVGALPNHEAANVTGALKLPREFTTTLVPALSPGIVDTVAADVRCVKSGMETIVGVTEAGTAIVPEIMTGISVE
jgi:hypothetical protein